MSKVVVGVVGGVLAVGIAVFFLVREDKAAPEPQVSSVSEGMPEVQPPPIAKVDVPPSAAATPPEEKPVSPSAAPPSMPIRSEFEAVFKENRGIESYHAAMENEPRDPSWAASTEDHYRRAFATNVELGKYGVPSVECRSTHCEIQMLAYGAPKMEPAQWGNLLGRGLMDAPVAANADSVRGDTPTAFTFGSKVVDGTTALIFHVIFERARARN